MKQVTEDIFAEWKRNRFILANSVLNDREGLLVILTDFVFWASHIEELMEWCRIYGGEINGSTVYFSDQDQYLLFCLRWQ